MDKLLKEKSAIVTKLVKAYRRLKDNNYVFSGTGDWYDTYVPPTKISTSVDGSLQLFLNNCCIITDNKEDYEFTENLFDAYKKFASSKKDDIYWFQSLDAFSKAAKNYFSLTPARKRNDRDPNAKRCYLGIKLKADESSAYNNVADISIDTPTPESSNTSEN
jgi:pyoverdine/dityrosine biosynthesis protein Dit1